MHHVNILVGDRGMKMKAYWHIHHDRLLEFSDNIQKRIDYIKDKKPIEEIKRRLHLLKPIQGKLPEAIIKAGAARDKAWAVYSTKASRGRAGIAYAKAGMAYDVTSISYNKTLTKHAAKIDALHRKECPDCPWDGTTIFPDKERE